MSDEQLQQNLDFDPMADIDFEYDPMNYVPPIEKPEDYDDAPIVKEELPAKERIAKAFRGMPGDEKLLSHVIDYCREERDSQEVYGEIERFLNGRICMYSPEIVCSNLLNAGALEIVERPSVPAPEAASAGDSGASEGTTEDSYESIAQPPEFSYRSTEDGIAAIEETDARADRDAFLDANESYAPVIQAVLKACAQEGGAGKKELDKLVDDDPLCQNPRRRSGFFIKNLEAHDLLVFDAKWKTTELGKSFIEQ